MRTTASVHRPGGDRHRRAADRLVGPTERPAEHRPGVRIGTNDLGGVVTGPNGPEAGVWVIAETTDLPTKFAKIVVTDERGRYVMPDLPKAQIQRVGARLRAGRFAQGQSEPGRILDLHGGGGAERRPRRRSTIRRSTGIRC